MLARSALVLLVSALALVAPSAVAPGVLGTFAGKGTASMSLDGVPCGPEDAPLVLTIGPANAASHRPATLAAPGEGGIHVGSGGDPSDPMVSSSCVLFWTGTLAGTPSTGFVGESGRHVGPGPECEIDVSLGAIGVATPVTIVGCHGALVGNGEVDFSPFLTG